jgi:hypothetical protein
MTIRDILKLNRYLRVCLLDNTNRTTDKPDDGSG